MGFVLDREKDATRERVNIKETLKSLQIQGLQSIYPENRVVINGFEICEKPEFNMAKIYIEDPIIWGFGPADPVAYSCVK